MTFNKFESLFLAKYPEGKVFKHGEFAQTERNKKVAVVFNGNGKVYEYYGAYEDILARVGIKVISKARLHNLEMTLAHYKEWHGKPWSLFGATADYSKEIERYTADIEDIKANYIIV